MKDKSIVTKTPEYTQSDCGCYVDNIRGLYMVEYIIRFANSHGAAIVHDMGCGALCKADGCSLCECDIEYWDEATDYMNEHYDGKGCYWGTIEHTGDWGLWKLETEEG